MKKYILLSVMSLFVFVFLSALSVDLHAAIIFENNFDGQADWQPHPGTNDTSPAGSTSACGQGNCTGQVPTGWSFFRSTGLWWGPTYQDTIRVNGDNYHGASGKAFTEWNESNTGASGDGWGSDGILVKTFPDEPEVYVQFRIKMQPGWKWASGSPQIKLFRVLHYDGGDAFTFFSGGNGAPIYVYDVKNSDTYGWRHVPSFRCDPQATDYMCPNNPNGSGHDSNFPGTPSFTSNGQLGDGQWHRYDFYVKMNTYGGSNNWNSDGIIKAWQDGVLLENITNNKWINSGTNNTIGWNYVGIGGNAYNNYNDASLHSEQWYAIDDVVISTTPLLKTPSPMTGIKISP
jgi:hypothetical protein